MKTPQVIAGDTVEYLSYGVLKSATVTRVGQEGRIVYVGGSRFVFMDGIRTVNGQPVTLQSGFPVVQGKDAPRVPDLESADLSDGKPQYLAQWSDENTPHYIARDDLANLLRGNRKAKRGDYAHKGIDPRTMADAQIRRAGPGRFVITRGSGLSFHAYPLREVMAAHHVDLTR